MAKVILIVDGQEYEMHHKQSVKMITPHIPKLIFMGEMYMGEEAKKDAAPIKKQVPSMAENFSIARTQNLNQ